MRVDLGLQRGELHFLIGQFAFEAFVDEGVDLVQHGVHRARQDLDLVGSAHGGLAVIVALLALLHAVHDALQRAHDPPGVQGRQKHTDGRPGHTEQHHHQLGEVRRALQLIFLHHADQAPARQRTVVPAHQGFAQFGQGHKLIVLRFCQVHLFHDLLQRLFAAVVVKHRVTVLIEDGNKALIAGSDGVHYLPQGVHVVDESDITQPFQRAGATDGPVVGHPPDAVSHADGAALAEGARSHVGEQRIRVARVIFFLPEGDQFPLLIVQVDAFHLVGRQSLAHQARAKGIGVDQTFGAFAGALCQPLLQCGVHGDIVDLLLEALHTAVKAASHGQNQLAVKADGIPQLDLHHGGINAKFDQQCHEAHHHSTADRQLFLDGAKPSPRLHACSSAGWSRPKLRQMKGRYCCQSYSRQPWAPVRRW